MEGETKKGVTYQAAFKKTYQAAFKKISQKLPGNTFPYIQLARTLTFLGYRIRWEV